MYIDLNTFEYPISEGQLRALFPLTSFTDPFEPPEGYDSVALREPPPYDTITQTLVEGEPEADENGYFQTWVVTDAPAEQVAKRVAAIREVLKRAATDKRWRVETGGMTLPNGARILTGKDDQARITATIAGMEGAGITSVDFKSADGWVKVTLEALKDIRSAMARHVQACFSAERAHHEAIDAAPVSDLAGYDINAGWGAQP